MRGQFFAMAGEQEEIVSKSVRIGVFKILAQVLGDVSPGPL